MTEHTDTKIHKMVIDADYQQAALTRIRKMVNGNKVDPESVVLKNFEGEVLEFQAEMIVDVTRSSTQKTVGGKAQASYIADSESSVQKLMIQEYLGLRQDPALYQKIHNIITTMPAHGFGKGGMKFPLSFWRKSFAVHMACQDCGSAGRIRCKRCNGYTTLDCSRCYGSGQCTCSYCNGATTIVDPNRGRIPCPTCYGRGKVGCSGCRQTGKVTCSQCSGKGNIQCSSCAGSGWMSVIHDMFLEAHTTFDYPRDKLPDKIVKLIDKDGEKIANYAVIQIVHNQQSFVNATNPHKLQEAQEAEKEKVFRVIVLYNVFLPYSNLTFEIQDKPYYAFLYGIHGSLDHASPFLDQMLGEAQRKLQDAADKRGDVYDSLRRAAEYRTAREALMAASQFGVGRAAKELKKTNAIGLSNEKIRTLIDLSDRALKGLTRLPRLLGLMVGLGVTAGLAYVYFTAPMIRGPILGQLPKNIPEWVPDLLAGGLGCYLGALTIQAIAGTSLKSMMKKIMPADAKLSGSMKLGPLAFVHMGLSVISFFALLEILRQMHLLVPLWYQNLLGRLLEFIF